MPYNDCEAKFDGVCTGVTVPVLIDDNMETYMCHPCVNVARTEIDVEILEGD